MLWILPGSGKVIIWALRFAVVLVEPYTVVLPRIFIIVDVDWVTVTVLYATPAPATVTVAVLGAVPVFAEVAVTVIAALFAPETGDTLSQLASSVIVHVVLDEILNVPVDPDAEPSEILVGDTFKYFVAGPGVYVQKTEYL